MSSSSHFTPPSVTALIETTRLRRRSPFHLLAAAGRWVTALAIAAMVLFAASAGAAPFTAGRLAVLQADSASANNTTVHIVELDTTTAGQTPTNSIAIDGVTVPNELRFSGSATSTGYLSRSADGQLLTFTGHNATATGVNANTLLPRGVATLNQAGTFALPTTYTGANGNQARSATTLDNSTWFIADQGGIYTNGTSAANPAANVRSIRAFGSNVYVLQNSSTGTVIVVSTVSAATGGTITGLPGLTNDATAQDFYLVSSGANGSAFDILYVLTTANLKKYSLVTGSWVSNGTYTGLNGFGLTAAVPALGSANLYVSTGTGATAANTVVKLTDTAGYNAAINITTGNNVILYTAPSGTTVKGVAFAPVALLPDLAVGLTAPASATAGANFDYTISAANNGVTNATGVAVNFTIPAGLSFVSAAGNSGFSGVNNSGTVNFTGGSINAGANATLSVTVTTAVGGAYTAAAGAAVVDPANTIAEGNEANNASTVAAATNVLSAPAITTHPNPSQTIASGATASLTVAASGYLPPTFQWYQGVSGDTSSPVGGATSANFTTPALTNTTSYWARATNATGTADSNTAVVNVSSANANLSNLTINPGTLNEAFAGGTLAYTATVANATTSITVTPTTADSMATVTVNTTPVVSGTPSGSINLNVGSNVIAVAVTAPDLVTVKNYTITVTRLSNNADLSNLVVTPGTLNEAFAAGTTAYTVTVPNTTTSLTVTPTVAQAAATVKVNNVAVASGTPSGSLSLNVGVNHITVAVTAQDLSLKTYTIAVTRTGSNNANLTNLALSTGAFSPSFVTAKTDYVQVVPNATASVTLTPTVEDSTATVTVNAVAVTSGSPSSAIPLAEGLNTIVTAVTAADTTTTKTYTTKVLRQANTVLAPGSIAFTGFNADGVDNLAFVTLQTLPAGTVIIFSDDEWNGTDWIDAGESAFAWTANSAVAAGTIVTIDSVSTVYSGTAVSNLGTLTGIPEGTNNAGLSNGADAVYAFQSTGTLNANGNLVPTVFLALIANDDPVAGGNYSLAGTGLSEAAGTAIIFPDSDDGVRYKGVRNGQLNFADYLPLLADRAANWETVGGGDGTTYLPFSAAPFTAGPVALVTINDVSVAEGDVGTTAMTFTVTRSSNGGAFTLQYATANGTGANAATLANNDYVAGSGTVTFTAGGALTQPVTVLVNGDTALEHDETLFVNLSNVVATTGNATISDAQGVGTILTDDAFAPVITTPPASQSIATGTSANLNVVADGFPLPTYQWYAGLTGDTANPVGGATSANFTTPVLLAPANYWVRVSNTQGSADSSTANITVSYGTPFGSTNINVLNPNQGAWDPAGVNVGGTQFVNLGLQGVGRFPATAKDPVTGESVGSVSDLQITGWHKNGNGTYSGTLNTLPDRGYNSGAIFSNYAARINTFDFTFTPYTSSTPTALQNQVALTFTGSTRFTYDHDGNPATAPVFTTGLLANGGVPLFGTTVPVATGVSTQSDGPVTNRLTVDSEGLVLDSRLGRDGSGWLGDEYGAYIYHFNSTKQIDGLVPLPAALLPHATNGGPISFIDVPANVDGRRVNQGMEGLAQSPDGTKLFGLMQSATMQDSGSGSQGRFNTRLVVFDVSASNTPATPLAQYVIQLPRIDDTGLTNNGNSVDKTAAQSSIIALNDHQLLILSRDGNGRGVAGSATPVFKSILLADLSTATNINGLYDAAGAAVAPGGVLAVAVTPLAWTEALNMIGKLNSTMAEVQKFGLNLSGGNGDINTICEKWEALGLVSAQDPANPNDYFLFIANDNDFLTGSGEYLDTNGNLQSYDAGLENDTLVLTFRVRFTTPEILVQQPVGTDVAKGGSVDFGAPPVAAHVAKTFTIKNSGTSTLNINSIGSVGGQAAEFAVNLTGTSLSLAPDATTTFDVTFTPSAIGARASTLQIVNNDFNEGSYAIALTGSGAASPNLAVSLVHNGTFHQRDLGDSFTLTVTNTGAGPTDGSPVSVTAALPAGFVPAASNNGTFGGWTVSVSGQNVTATRTDVLAAGNSYPALTIAVNVSSTAAASLDSTATVSGGGDTYPVDNTVTHTTSVSAPVAVTFLGVASGDAGSTSATVWTRINQTEAVTVTAQVSPDPGFGGTPLTFAGSPDPARDYTLKLNATGLTAGTVYYYRFTVSGTGETSNVGTFKTAPATNASVPVHFAFSGDNDGLMRPFALASQVPAEALDFYVNLGDTIYETASNVAGSIGASYLNSPSVTLSGVIPAPSATGATQAQLQADYYKKYRENFLPVNTGGQSGLRGLYASQGNYTVYDNHELGNRQYINGGAPAGGPVGGMTTGAGVDARVSTNDVTNPAGPFMNQSTGFLTLQGDYLDYMPVADRGLVNAPTDLRTHGTKQLYFAQQWGKNAVYINVDARTYRDIRVKTAANADDTGARADNPSRTMLGATQLAWLKQNLLAAQNAGTPWKFITVSDPIDQLGPIGGALALQNLPNFGPGSTYAPVSADGGKSWQGGYRAERNDLLKFIADNHITNVVFLSTDDHQNRVNELTYSPTGQTGVQSSYVKVPYCFQIVAGPLGATGPDTITDHSFSVAQGLASSLAAAQTVAGVEPIGLQGYPGLKNVVRENDPTAGTNPTAVDFYSPDTFNYNVLDVSADGQTLTVTSKGLTAEPVNTAREYGANGNTVRTIFSFQVDAVADPVVYDGATTASPVLTDGQVAALDFGTAEVFTTVSRTFTVQNTGGADLTGLAVTFSGANAADFAVGTAPAASLVSGATTTFTVQFTPQAGHTRNAVLHLASNAPGAKASYDFPLTGNASLVASANDAISTTVGVTRIYPLANDRGLPANTTIVSATGTGVTISADGRSLLIPAGFTGSITYETSHGTTGTVDVTAGTPATTPRRFTGLLYDTNGAIAGWTTINVNAKGSASTQVLVGSVRGKAKFGFNATATTASANTELGGITFVRNVDGTLGATLVATGGTFTSTMRPVSATSTVIKYQVALASVDSSIPGGGYATILVKRTSDVTMVGTLPDGRPFNAATSISDNGTIAFYAVESRFVIPAGVLSGELTSGNLAATDLTGEVAWSKPAQGGGAKGNHLGGVNTLLTANGCIYAGSIPLNGAGTLNLTGGNLAADQHTSVTVTAGIPSLPAGSLTGWAGVKAANGTFRAKVKVPGIIRPVSGGGVYLPKSNSAWGFFPGTTLGGRIELTMP